ncbi:hypothetical protein N8J89_04050 [Crossiella sp. CA-258035]|uniref:hypothetical protein n=1 Tax=Crossiella sp. CA-258035 TaxID=2981138 RepID=UPI0024BD2F64|nr:hypothetical protein [Crossiella sp. CA-258035]WHT20254.1 hypothetical protein N8J89_04050 [Crossiella sp. CA-258035]
MTPAPIVLLLGLVVMLSLALIPSRHRGARCVAVLGWAALFLDGSIANHWLDAAGIVVFATALAWVLRQELVSRSQRDRG